MVWFGAGMSTSAPELVLPIVRGVKREFNPGLTALRELVYLDPPKLRKRLGQWKGPIALIWVAETFLVAETGLLELVEVTLAGYSYLSWF